MPVKTLGFREIVGVIGMERPDNERERMDEICLKGVNLFFKLRYFMIKVYYVFAYYASEYYACFI